MPQAAHCSVPAKLILFGEWAVLDAWPAVGVALSPRFSLQESLDANSEALHIESCFESGSTSWRIHQFENMVAAAPEFFKPTARVLESLFSLPDRRAALAGRHLKLSYEWKAAEGLGSSSALFLCLSQWARNAPLAEPDFAELQVKMRALHGYSGSGMDLAIQLLGGCVVMQDLKPRAITLEIPENLLCVHTGEKVSTAALLVQNPVSASQRKSLGQSSTEFLNLGQKSGLNSGSNSWDWSKAISEHYDILKGTGLVPNAVAHAQRRWKQKGWIKSLKTTGAGGGDTLLVYLSEPEARSKLEPEIAAQGWWTSDYSLGATGLSLLPNSSRPSP